MTGVLLSHAWPLCPHQLEGHQIEQLRGDHAMWALCTGTGSRPHKARQELLFFAFFF